MLRLPSYTTEDQRDMMKQFVDDPDVCEFEEYLHDVNTPSSPTSPVTPSKPVTVYQTLLNFFQIQANSIVFS